MFWEIVELWASDIRRTVRNSLYLVVQSTAGLTLIWPAKSTIV